jgi:hypothetical protein
MLKQLQLIVLASAAHAAFAQAPVPLHEAIAARQLSVRVVAGGASTGAIAELFVKRLSAKPVVVWLVPGTVLLPQGDAAEDLAASRVLLERVNGKDQPGATIQVFADEREHQFVLEAFSLDFFRGEGAAGTAYSVSAPNLRAGKIIHLGIELKAGLAAIQSALWIDRDRVSDTELAQRFAVRAADAQLARALQARAEQMDATALLRPPALRPRPPPNPPPRAASGPEREPSVAGDATLDFDDTFLLEVLQVTAEPSRGGARLKLEIRNLAARAVELDFRAGDRRLSLGPHGAVTYRVDVDLRRSVPARGVIRLEFAQAGDLRWSEGAVRLTHRAGRPNFKLLRRTRFTAQ